MNKKRGALIILSAIFIFTLGLIFVNANNEMTVEANFVGYEAPMVRVNVPDYISLGPITPNEPFDETSAFKINNTGRANINVTPMLSTGHEAIFDYLAFRTQKTLNGTAVIPTPIEEFDLSITHGANSTVYMSINLTDFTGTLSSNNITLNSVITFTAVEA